MYKYLINVVGREGCPLLGGVLASDLFSVANELKHPIVHEEYRGWLPEYATNENHVDGFVGQRSRQFPNKIQNGIHLVEGDDSVRFDCRFDELSKSDDLES